MDLQEPNVGNFGLPNKDIKKRTHKKTPQIPEHPNSHVSTSGMQREVTNTKNMSENSSTPLSLRFHLKIRFQEQNPVVRETREEIVALQFTEDPYRIGNNVWKDDSIIKCSLKSIHPPHPKLMLKP